MAVFPDRIVLKNSTDGEAAIVSAIETGGSDEITQGEIVLGLTPSAVKFYTKAGDGSIVSIGGTGTGSVTSLSGLSDVNILSPLPSDGDALVYDAATSLWVARNLLDDVELGDIGDVDLSVDAEDGQYLAYELSSESWKPVDFRISTDLNPSLGGNLNVGSFDISNSSGDVSFSPSSGEIVVKGGSSEGKITLNCTANTHGVSIQSPPHAAAATYTLTLPTTSGTAGQALITTDGTGVLEWSTLTGSGTVTSVDGSGANGITVTGGPITGAGTLDVSLDDTGVTPGSYTAASITVDAQGRITSASSGSVTELELGDLSDVNLDTPPTDNQVLVYNETAGEWVPETLAGTGTVTSVDGSGSNGITVTGGPITESGTLNISLGNTSVSAGSYTLASFTVDGQGRLTAASSGPLTTNGDLLFQFGGSPNRLAVGAEGQALTVVSGYPTWTDLGVGGTVTSVDIIGGAGISSTGGPVTTSGSITIGLEANGVTPGTYENATFTVDATGRVIAASSGTDGAVEEAPSDGQQYARQNEGWSVVASGGAVDSVNGQTGEVSLGLNDITDVDTATNAPASGQVLEWNGASWVPATLTAGGVTSIIAGSGISVDQATGDVTISSTGGGGGGIEEAPEDGTPYVRQDAGWVPASTGDGGGSGAGVYLQESQAALSGFADFTGLGYSGILQKVQSTADAWIVLYSSAAERTADAARAYNADPAPGSGVLFEAYVAAGGTIVATPGTTYMNNDSGLTEAVYAAVRDQSGAAVNATVTISAYGLAAITAVNGGAFGSGL